MITRRAVCLLLVLGLAPVVSAGDLGRVAAKAPRPPAPLPQLPPPQGQSAADFLQWYRQQRPANMPVPSTGAIVSIVKFTDLECPACGLTHEAYKPVLARFEAQFPGAVRLVTRDYPLNVECNPGLQRTIHEAACEAAVAVRLARRHGRAAAVEDFLYANHQVLTPESVRKAALLLGEVSETEFTEGRAAALQAVKADASMGRALGIGSTPTFVINGIVVPKVMEPALFEAVITYELRKAGKIK